MNSSIHEAPGYSPERFGEKFVRRLEQGVREPLGGDRFASLSCSAFISHLEKNPEVLGRIIDLQNRRGTSTSVELMNLATVHAVNYIMTAVAGIPSYPYTLKLDDQDKWEEVYADIMRNHPDEYFHILENNRSNTNIPNRGAHLPFVKHTAFPDRKVMICDAGASGNGILGKLAYNGTGKDEPYRIDLDSTLQNGIGLIKRYADMPVDFLGVGYDLTNMYASEEAINWYLLNDYIKNIDEPNLIDKRERMNLYRTAQNVSFFQGDMTQPHFRPGSFDIINYSSTLYELPEEMRKQALSHAFEAVHPTDGLVLVSDRVIVKDGELIFTKDRGEGSYGLALTGPRTGWRWINPLRMSDSTCFRYMAGPDLDIYLSSFPLQAECCQQRIVQL